MGNKKLSLTGLEIPFILAIIALFFWSSPVLLPFKLLTVFFHELSHAIAALLTGGKVFKIGINLNQGGVTNAYGGWPIIVLSAGYLGSLLWGSGLLLTSLSKGINKALTRALGIVIAIVSVIWVRGFESLAITLSTAALLIYISFKLKEEYCSIFIKFISLMSCFYVVYDIKDDLLDRTVSASDAYKLSKLIFPSFMHSFGSYLIGLLWMALAIFILWKVFCYAFTKNRK